VSPWEELVSTALVGTERRPLPAGPAPAPGPGEPGGAGGAVSGPGEPAGHEAVLLDRAALLVARRRAGRAAGRAEPLPPAPAERLPQVARPAGRRLAAVLTGRHAGLLLEWLEAAAGRGLRAPEHLLPELLERGRGERSLRPAIAVVAGARGRWLAGLNPRWAYLLGGVAGEAPGRQARLPDSTERRHAAFRIRTAAQLDSGLVQRLQGLPGPWDGELAAAVLDKISGAEASTYHLVPLCQLAAERLAPELFPKVASLRPDPPPPVARLAATLRFRHDMLKELQ